MTLEANNIKVNKKNTIRSSKSNSQIYKDTNEAVVFIECK